MTHALLTQSQKKDLARDLRFSAITSAVVVLVCTLLMVFVPKLWTELQRHNQISGAADITRAENANEFWQQVSGELPDDTSTPQGRLAHDIRNHSIESETKDTFSSEGKQIIETVSVPKNYYLGLGDTTGLCPFKTTTYCDGGDKFSDDFVRKVHQAEGGNASGLLVPIEHRDPIEDSAGMLWLDPFLMAWLLCGGASFLICVGISRYDVHNKLPLSEYFWPRFTDLPYHRAGSALVALPVFVVVEVTRVGLYVVKKRQIKRESMQAARELEAQRLRELEKEQSSPLFDKLNRARELRRQLDALPQTEEVVRQQEYASQLIGFLTEDPRLYTEHQVNETAVQIGARLRELASSADAVVETQKELGLR